MMGGRFRAGSCSKGAPRLLFVPNPHVRLDRSWAAPYVPLELLSAMATAAAAGAQPALFDVNRLVEHGRLEPSPLIWERAALLLSEADPDLVLLETWTGTLHNTLQLAAATRRRCPDLPLVLTGAGTSAVAARVLTRFPALDGVIRGEPEPAVAALAAHDPGQGRALSPAPGLVRREGINGAGTVINAELAFVQDLEALPRPSYHLALLQPGETIPIEPGRGCAQGCTFCALAGHWPREYRPREPGALAAEMIALSEAYPGSALDLTQDPTYFSDPRRTAALCDALADRASLTWSCHARVDRLDDALLGAMARAGCSGVLFGVESGCPTMQRTLGKRLDLTRLAPTVASAERLGVETRAAFFIGHPEEDHVALDRTAEALVLAREAGAEDTPIQLLRAYPGSAVHQRWAEQLQLEPLLHVAAPGDDAGRALIEAHPWLLSASYRVPARLPREVLLARWIALSALPDALTALWRHGLRLPPLLRALRLDDSDLDLDGAVLRVGQQLEQAALASEALLDPVTLRDLIAYHTAAFTVGREITVSPGAVDDDDGDALTLLREGHTRRVRPRTAAPWRLLHLHTEVDLLCNGQLTPADPAERHERTLLLAKLGDPDAASYYTRRSFVVETFELDPVGAALMELATRQLDLETIGNTVALQLRRAPKETVEACAEVTEELVQAGVLGLEVCEPSG